MSNNSKVSKCNKNSSLGESYPNIYIPKTGRMSVKAPHVITETVSTAK